MFDKFSQAAEKVATHVSRRAFLGRVGQGALATAGVLGGMLAFASEAKAFNCGNGWCPWGTICVCGRYCYLPRPGTRPPPVLTTASSARAGHVSHPDVLPAWLPLTAVATYRVFGASVRTVGWSRDHSATGYAPDNSELKVFPRIPPSMELSHVCQTQSGSRKGCYQCFPPRLFGPAWIGRLGRGRLAGSDPCLATDRPGREQQKEVHLRVSPY